jgi:cephalosporin hydroxylase
MAWSDLPGWFDYEDVYKEAVEHAPNFATMVEVGVAFGRSIAFLADEAMRVTKKLRIFGVDPWVDDWDSDKPTWGANHAEQGRELGGPFNAMTTLMHQHAPRQMEYVRLVRAPSVMAARMFDDASVFFVFIDGSHHYEDVKADLAAWEPKIAPGGIFAGHDHTDAFPDVLRAVRERWGIFGNASSAGATHQRGACWWRRY